MTFNMRNILLSAVCALFLQSAQIGAQTSTYFKDSKEWLQKAEACRPELSYQSVTPLRLVRSVADKQAFQGWRMELEGTKSQIRRLR